jgi:hypothetical protein
MVLAQGVSCRTLRYSRHAFERMVQRGISPEMISQVLASGSTIAVYPDDTPYPSALLLGFTKDGPLHVVVARDEESGDCQVVTVYRPDPSLWDESFQSRRSR